jgi:hypothetical protein
MQRSEVPSLTPRSTLTCVALLFMLLPAAACSEDAPRTRSEPPRTAPSGPGSVPGWDAGEEVGSPSTGISLACPARNLRNATVFACESAFNSCSESEAEATGALGCFRHEIISLPDLGDFQLRDDAPTVIHVAAGAVDADEAVDVVAVVQGQAGDTALPRHALVLYRGTATGELGTGELLGTWGSYAGAPRIVDLDRDGHIDLVLVGSPGGDAMAVMVWYGEATSEFQREDYTLADPGRDYQIETVETGDLNGDGQEDIALDGGLWLAGSKNRAFGEPQTLTVASGSRVYRLASISDLDGDGARDLVGAIELEPRAVSIPSVVRGMGDGDSTVPETLPGASSQWFGAVDVDADGIEDLVGIGASAGSHATYSWIAGADGRYLAEPIVSELSTFLSPGGHRRILRGDFNSDGVTDLAYVPHLDAVGCELSAELRTVRVLLGDGNGKFAEPSCMPAVEEPPSGLSVADIDGDGLDDLLVATRAGIELLRSSQH